MTTLRIGIVGSRFAAHLHLLAYRRVYGVEARLAGVTSPTAERREAFARETGATPYADLTALLPHVEIVDVCSPPATHEPVALQAIEAGKHVFIEKPFTGAFAPRGGAAGKEALLRDALASADRMVDAARRRGLVLAYAENWIYAPAVQKEREIVEKTKAVEGRARGSRAIRPARVSCRVHEITRLPGYRDRGFLRTDYEDVEDYSQLHVTFDDGTVADVFATELVLGGVHNWLEVFANNHRTTCRLNPVNLLDTYNPEAAQFRDLYLVEKLGTKEGWSHPAADEEWQQGFYAEIQDFLECCAEGRRPQSDADIARDTVATLYAGYVSAERNGQEVPVPIGGHLELGRPED